MPDRSRVAVVRAVASAVARGVRARPLELAVVFLAFPITLVAVYLLPGTDSWRLSLSASGVFENRWTLWTAFASSFVHTTPDHLLNSLANYWLVAAAAYPLTLVARWRRRLLYAVVGYVALVPLAASWTTLYALGSVTNAPSAGFSALNSAFLGYLLVVWFAAFARETDGAVDARWSVVAVAGSLSVVFLTPATVAYFPQRLGVGALFGLFALAVAGALLRAGHVPWDALDGIDVAPHREFCFVFAAGVVAAGVVGSLVVVPFGSNVYAHLAGYVVGVLLPAVSVVMEA